MRRDLPRQPKYRFAMLSVTVENVSLLSPLAIIRCLCLFHEGGNMDGFNISTSRGEAYTNIHTRHREIPQISRFWGERGDRSPGLIGWSWYAAALTRPVIRGLLDCNSYLRCAWGTPSVYCRNMAGSQLGLGVTRPFARREPGRGPTGVLHVTMLHLCRVTDN